MSAVEGIARFVNRILEPFGIEVRRRISADPRTSTLSSTLLRLKALGFKPETVVDVGVATGTQPLYQVFPAARHILVEPLAEFAADIDRIVAGLPRAEHIRAAAAGDRGPVVLNVGANLFVTSRHTICDPTFRTGEQRIVQGVTLDDVWVERQLQAPGLIKIDVEGDELGVLRGARQALRSCEYLVLEVAVRDIFVGVPRFETVISRLAEYGFVVDDILEPARGGPRGDLYTVDVAFVPEHGWLRR